MRAAAVLHAPVCVHTLRVQGASQARGGRLDQIMLGYELLRFLLLLQHCSAQSTKHANKHTHSLPALRGQGPKHGFARMWAGPVGAGHGD